MKNSLRYMAPATVYVALLASFLGVPAICLGQNDTDRGGFFPDNYAGEVGGIAPKGKGPQNILGQRPASGAETHEQSLPTTPREVEEGENGFIELGVESTATPVVSPNQVEKSGGATDTNGATTSDQIAAIPVQSIGLITAAGTTSLEKSLTEAASLATKCDLDVKKVMLVTNGFGGKPLSPEASLASMQLSIRGGAMELAAEPPKWLGVTKSPSWLVWTEKGLVVIEGAPSLATYVNSKCEFIDNPEW